MLPMTVLRRFDCVLEHSKELILAKHQALEAKNKLLPPEKRLIDFDSTSLSPSSPRWIFTRIAWTTLPWVLTYFPSSKEYVMSFAPPGGDGIESKLSTVIVCASP
jgi:hypothetical protein